MFWRNPICSKREVPYDSRKTRQNAPYKELCEALDIIQLPEYNNSSGRQRRVSTQAMKRRGVPASLAAQSFREGLCRETSSRSRRKPKENTQSCLAFVRQLFLTGEIYGQTARLCKGI